METGRMKLALSAGALALSMALAGCGGSSSGGGAQSSGNGGNNGDNQETQTQETKSLTGTVAEVKGLIADREYDDFDDSTDNTVHRITLAAGRTATHGGIEFECVGGSDCTLIVTQNGDDIILTYEIEDDGTEDAQMVRIIDHFNVGTDFAAFRLTTGVTDVRNAQTGLWEIQSAPAARATLRDSDGDLTLSHDGENLSFAAKAGFDPRKTDSQTINQSEAVTDPAAPTVPGGWTSVRLSKDWGQHVTEGFLYTNIEEEKTVRFQARYDDLRTVDHDDDNAYGQAATDTPTVKALLITGNGDPDGSQRPIGGAHVAKITLDWPTFLNPIGEGAPAESWPVTADGRTLRSIDGTYDGFPGTFWCVGTDGTNCSVGRNDDGDLELVGDTDTGTDGLEGSWYFVADTDATVTETEPYLTFGVWLTHPDGGQGNSHTAFVSYDGSHTFADTHPVANSTINYLGGKATYNGGAVGYYAKRGDEDKVHSESGRFTATAQLNADFGKFDDTADTKISGAISNFMENGESLGDWRLTLNEINAAAATAAAPGTITGGGFSGGTVGGTAEGDSFSGGTWSGSFYGFANVVDNDLGEIRPSGVAGTFNAWTESTLRNPQADETAPSLSVQGAFGAIR